MQIRMSSYLGTCGLVHAVNLCCSVCGNSRRNAPKYTSVPTQLNAQPCTLKLTTVTCPEVGN